VLGVSKYRTNVSAFCLRALCPIAPRLIAARLMTLCLMMLCNACAATASAQDVRRGEYEVYRCQNKKAAEIESLLVDLLPEDPTVHLVVDSKSNSLLLRGSPEVQKIAQTLLQQVDRPASSMAQRGPQTPHVKSYKCPPGQVDRWLASAISFCHNYRGVRITAARETDQLLVLATANVHAQLENHLRVNLEAAGASPRAGSTQSGASHRTVPPAGQSLGAPRVLSGPPASQSNANGWNTTKTNQLLHLRSANTSGIEQQLLALFGRRLRSMHRDGQEVFILPIDEQRSLEYQLDPVRNIIAVHGPQNIVAQFSMLVDALDSNGRHGRRISALHVERTAPTQLNEAVNAYREGRPSPSQSQRSRDGRNDQSNLKQPGADNGVRLVNYVFQQSPAGGGAGPLGSPLADDTGAVVPNVPGLEDLDVQTLPDLDVIILRGRDQDVEQLTEIIRELERLSAETKPRIHIYQLTNALGESVAEIVDDVQEDLVGRRQGRVTVTPLVKPNALLLIGWGEAVESIIELITKLDRPVPPEAQFAIFPLQHAAVADVQDSVEQFFGARGGLAPRIQTSAYARTNSLIVYAAPRDMQEVMRLIKELDVARSEAVNRAQIFRVDNALAVDLADTLEQAIQAAQSGQSGRSAVLELLAVDEQGQQVLRSGMLGEVSITPNARNNTLIVTGPPQAMELVAAFIEQLDSPGDSAQIKVFRVINGDATNLVAMLRSLLPSQVGQTYGPQLPTAPEEESLAPLRFSVEVRSNSIVAVGSEGDLRIVEALLTRLDQSESMYRKNVVYLLKNSPAIDVASSINDFLRSQRTLEAAEPGQSNPFQDLEREVIVVPEPVGNRLIVSATPRYFDEITQLIEKLDEPPPQVMIQVLIAEVTLGDRDEFGVELGLQDTVLFDRSLLGDLVTTIETNEFSTPAGILTSTTEIIQAASSTPGFSFNNQELGNSGSDKSLATSKKFGGQALSSFSLGRESDDANFAGMVLSASSQNVSVLIRALQQTQELRILSRPIVRTLDNQPAFIQVGQRVPRIVGSTFGVNGQSNAIDLENVGLILGVTPRISPDGNVVMEIDAEKSKVGPEEEGIPVAISTEGTIIRSPRVDTITAQTTVSVADGETVVLGGLISTEEETEERRTPFLSDIPVLGHLFRYDFSDERRNEMIIILTPTVIRTPADAEKIKQAEFARMSWCAANVYDVYGDVGMDFRTDLAVPTDDHDTEVIYPDLNPRGEPTRSPTPLPPDAMPLIPQGTGIEAGSPYELPPATPPTNRSSSRSNANLPPNGSTR
jgi:general secretion pathway protein D